jgi:hypothetical protein
VRSGALVLSIQACAQLPTGPKGRENFVRNIDRNAGARVSSNALRAMLDPKRAEATYLDPSTFSERIAH